MAKLADVLNVLEQHYPPATAESWDAVGLVCGDPDAEVRRVLFAVDPVAVVADEAIDWGADLIVTHHPLFLRPVHGVAATTPKGRLVHRLISNGIALYVAHTNADSAADGVNDALAAAIGLRDLRPLSPHPGEQQDKLIVFVPEPDAGRVLDALTAAGAGVIGNYERCAWTTSGTGTFRPGAGANPTIGRVGDIEEVAEFRLEMVLPRRLRAAVVDALTAAHPYEEPAYDIYELAALPASTGLGRIGTLEQPETLREFVRRVAGALPSTVAGVRAAGDPDAEIRQVAICGGAGDSFLQAARRAGVDAYVTGDLRHHPVSEAMDDGGPALVDVAHWAGEWPWLVRAANRLRADLSGEGTRVETHVSVVPTDPWTLHEPSRPTGAAVPEEGTTAER
ncbi:Nif3-like dinuclear metal center hexameric protein [Phytoactinopolyspora halotolerans]|uniref:GTP cyclohydrolase 1 type 2 homolog n=1 Tax=Phytoactinopolyspora halotolerans TaxID=1981512 RepID=A0A6L9SBU5_9ACTN|nr:Nif3-like dinuclear metal center hexameric protein [Phytoactinopolyspora halotolerans]NEE01998.1 Nif3-like dinuclear metal center hexameric protein [Phytoactinopolyspora halotolerans]